MTIEGDTREGRCRTQPKIIALMAEMIRRSVGVTLGDAHLATALAVHKQMNRRNPRRSDKEIARLSGLLPTRRDRSLVSVIPVFYAADMLGLDVAVLVSTEEEAREDVELYRAVTTELPTKASIHANQEGLAASRAGVTTINVGPPEVLQQLPGRAVIILRLPRHRTREVCSVSRRAVTLPEPD